MVEVLLEVVEQIPKENRKLFHLLAIITDFLFLVSLHFGLRIFLIINSKRENSNCACAILYINT